jgi:phosphatidylinositol 4-kinase
MIVKSGDDCRQEHLAVQLIGHFYDIFQEAGLPLWLRPYEVLVTSSHTALIETIYDTASIHSIKSRNSEVTSLRDFFCKKYVEGSPAFKLAQRNFVESMAGYSILCYILQVKDRHNSNLLIDEDGHIIHIDFGYMLSNSPGGVNFESAPFKLTRELLEVMDSDAEGTASEFYDYFKVLCIQGFLTCRKHAERIILLVEMMQDSGCPCFKGGPRTLQNMRKRFHLSLTEEQCVSSVLELIAKSLDAWRTRQYDYYQKVLNGIL